MSQGSLSIRNMTKGKHPRLPFANMTKAILGAKASVSLVFIGDKRAQTLNRVHRNKNYIPNVLTFPLGEREGEVFINLRQARRDAPTFETSYTTFVGHLFIHALLHLKGRQHGSKMEAVERTWIKKFNL